MGRSDRAVLAGEEPRRWRGRADGAATSTAMGGRSVKAPFAGPASAGVRRRCGGPVLHPRSFAHLLVSPPPPADRFRFPRRHRPCHGRLLRPSALYASDAAAIIPTVEAIAQRRCRSWLLGLGWAARRRPGAGAPPRQGGLQLAAALHCRGWEQRHRRRGVSIRRGGSSPPGRSRTASSPSVCLLQATPRTYSVLDLVVGLILLASVSDRRRLSPPYSSGVRDLVGVKEE